jgi:hypothetical protein
LLYNEDKFDNKGDTPFDAKQERTGISEYCIGF